MNLSNLFQRSCPKHPEKQVIYACYNKSCYLNRLLCKNCMKNHSGHSDNLLDEQEIESKIKESSTNCQQLIKQLNKMFDDIKYQFKLLISTLESQYILSTLRFNTMENQELNKNLNQLVIQKDKENTINYLFTQGFNSFKEQINKCLSNLTLHEQQIKVFTQEEMEMVEEYFQQGCEYCKWKDYVNAIKMFDSALQMNQNHLESLYNKGEALKMMNQYKESIEWYDKALAIDSKYTSALCGKGDALRCLKQYNEAINYLNYALQIDRNHEPSLSNMGLCLLNMGRLDEAEQFINYVIILNPNNQFNKNLLKILKERRQK